MRKILAAASFFGLAACSQPIAWNGPGWYLEMPHSIVVGSDFYAGPMSYDECEDRRKKEEVASRMLCMRYLTKPE